jgi:hypothetical protein
MRGTKSGFWKNYNRQQFAMAAACMPQTAMRRNTTVQQRPTIVVPPSSPKVNSATFVNATAWRDMNDNLLLEARLMGTR